MDGKFYDPIFLTEKFWGGVIDDKIRNNTALNGVQAFYKKLGSGHSTRSFLISHEILSILVLKVS